MNISTIYEDDCLLVVDKPSGTVVNRSESAQGETLQDWAERKLKIRSPSFAKATAGEKKLTPIQTGLTISEENKAFYERAGIVHRLDKDTSGCLLIAKDPQSFIALQSQFAAREVTKTYLVLVHGKMSAVHDTISFPVGRLPWNRRKFGVLSDGREAITSYDVISQYRKEQDFYALLRVNPRTGRTHQIRIHLKHIGHSVVGDTLYAGKHILRKDSQFCQRMFLHASALSFIHPQTKSPIHITADLPQNLADVLKQLDEV